MKISLPVLALVALASQPLPAQVAGDTVRVRIRPSSGWAHGRFVSLDNTQLTVTHVEQNQSYPLQSVARLEVGRRKNPLGTIVADAVACAAGAALAGLFRPDNQKPLFGSDGANIAVAAGVGLVVGVIEINVAPWRWKRVRLTVRGAP